MLIIRAVKAKSEILPTKSMAIIKILIVLIIPKTAENPRLSIYSSNHVDTKQTQLSIPLLAATKAINPATDIPPITATNGIRFTIETTAGKFVEILVIPVTASTLVIQFIQCFRKGMDFLFKMSFTLVCGQVSTLSWPLQAQLVIAINFTC